MITALVLSYRRRQIRKYLKVVTNIKEELHCKLNNLSTEQLNSVYEFVDSLEDKQPIEDEIPATNEDIDRIVESYRQQNKPLPIGLAKGKFVVPDDFNNPLPDEILNLFNNPQ